MNLAHRLLTCIWCSLFLTSCVVHQLSSKTGTTTGERSASETESNWFWKSDAPHPSPYQLQIFTSIYNPIVSTEQLERNLTAVDDLPVVEKPEFWVSAVNQVNRNEYNRWLCLVYLFKRHIRTGDSPAILGGFLGTQEWFVEDSLIPAGAFSKLPFDLQLEEKAFLYQPAFAKSQSAGIYLKVSFDGGLSTKTMIDIIYRREKAGEMKILELGATKGGDFGSIPKYDRLTDK